MIEVDFSIVFEIATEDETKKILKALEEYQAAYTAAYKMLNQKYNKRVKFDLELMGESAVDDFYESYDPKMYKRQLRLYKAAKVIVNDDEWTLHYEDDQYMPGGYSGVGPDYIYINSFVKGYHGGAIDGPDHPEPGTPWWKVHGRWKEPAARGPKPKSLIDDMKPQEYIDGKEEEWSNEYLKIVTPYYNKLIQAISSIGGD